MRYLNILPIIILLFPILFSFPAPLHSTPASSSGEAQIGIYWELLENHHQQNRAFLSQFIFTHKDGPSLSNTGWTFYFTFERDVIPSSVPNTVIIEQIAGELHRLRPTAQFPVLKKGDRLEIPFVCKNYILNASEAPSGGYFVFNGPNGAPLAPVAATPITVIPADPEKLFRYPDDRLPVSSPELRFQENEPLSLLPPEPTPWLIPSPLHMAPKTGHVDLSENAVINPAKGLEKEAAYLQKALRDAHGLNARISADGSKKTSISLTADNTDPANPAENYQLTILPDEGIRISAPGPKGVFYGIQTLRALLPPRHGASKTARYALPALHIADAPRFRYRGIHLDTARNFTGKADVLRLLELMAIYKLNTLHFHFSDDEGWRLEIPGLPELTEIGAFRGHTEDELDHLYPAYGSGPLKDPKQSAGGGYFSRSDFIEILRFAAERHIEIIPEIETPGHARAAIKAMDARYNRLMKAGQKEAAEQFLLRDLNDQSVYRSVQSYTDNTMCVCRESVYTFLEKVTDEIATMYAEAGLKLKKIHMGGDEVAEGVWEKSPLCGELKGQKPDLTGRAQLWSYFLTRFTQLLEKRGITPAGWQEAATVGPKVIPYIWNNVWGWGQEDYGQRLANQGYPVVIAYVTNLYFDLAYTKEWDEPGLYWGGFINTRKPFELTPSDIRKCAETDLNGNPLDKETLFQKVEPLKPEAEQNILGIQGHLWSEHLRSRELLDYQAFPKLLGLAERAWAAKPDWEITDNESERTEKREKAWNRFANIIGRQELPRLDALPQKPLYRIAPPGAVVQDGFLKINTDFPGLTIRYTIDGSDPAAGSPLYKKPVKLDTRVKIIKARCFSSSGRPGRVSEIRLR